MFIWRTGRKIVPDITILFSYSLRSVNTRYQQLRFIELQKSIIIQLFYQQLFTTMYEF